MFAVRSWLGASTHHLLQLMPMNSQCSTLTTLWLSGSVSFLQLLRCWFLLATISFQNVIYPGAAWTCVFSTVPATKQCCHRCKIAGQDGAQGLFRDTEGKETCKRTRNTLISGLEARAWKNLWWEKSQGDSFACFLFTNRFGVLAGCQSARAPSWFAGEKRKTCQSGHAFIDPGAQPAILLVLAMSTMASPCAAPGLTPARARAMLADLLAGFSSKSRALGAASVSNISETSSESWMC